MAFLCNLPACISRITLADLADIAVGVEVVRTCVRLPTVDSRGEFVAYEHQTRQAISDRDPEEFRNKATNADIIYQFDPNVPQDRSHALPWPYQHMQCETLSSAKTPNLPKGLWEIPLSEGMREALVASLTQPDAAEPPTLVSELRSGPVNKKFLGQSSGLVVGGRYKRATIHEIGHILRDTIRSVLPKVDGPEDNQISVLDTNTGQIVGGAGMGLTGSLVPLGPVVTDAMIASGTLPRPSSKMMVGKGGAEMLSGSVQLILGGSAAVGGGGASVTGGGAIVGVPVCVAGVALAANGAVTFVNGAKTVILAVCQWQDEAAAIGEPQPAAAGPSPGPTPGPTPPAVKPTPAPAKPAAQAKPPSASTAPTVAQTPTQTVTKTFHNPPPGVKKARNVHLAGKTHPKTGVPFDANGFPDFRAAGVVKKEVRIKMTGDRVKDRQAANKEANMKKPPDGYTWHHHQDGETMQLVPQKLHADTGHTGGVALGKEKP